MSDDDDGDYFIPLEDQRVFGAGIRRKGIAFVPSSTATESTFPTTADTSKSSDIGSRYLAIVLPKNNQSEGSESTDVRAEVVTSPTTNICAVCKQPLSSLDPTTKNSHKTSIAHQVCLEHSHPPSHLDRSNIGLRYLQGYGWDPDSRRGLGPRQEGISIPIKAKEKNDTAGLRERLDPEARKARNVHNPEDKKLPLNAKEVRKREIEARKRADRLRNNFYGPDLEKYLGAGT